MTPHLNLFLPLFLSSALFSIETRPPGRGCATTLTSQPLFISLPRKEFRYVFPFDDSSNFFFLFLAKEEEI